MGSEDSQIVLIFISAAAIVVLMAALAAVFVALHQKRVMAYQKHLQQLETDLQKEMLDASIEGQERERKRLAKDLHDGIGSVLTGLNFHLKHQLRQAIDNSKEATFLADACGMLEDGIAEVRRVSHNLMPATLEEFGLVQALEDIIEPLQQRGSLNLDLRVRGNTRRLPPVAELGLLRVVQELIQNTVRHAHASHITIDLTFATHHLELRYTDNGKGFGPDLPAGGIGIKNIRSRIQSVNGTLELNNGQEKGMEALIQIPDTPDQPIN
ncbi:MAG: hypothetical protein CMI36_09860 [Owenweeksia sp.]|nr:hypothetical protein [Owenweeksia sp.]MBF99287.1 hypothetical protein [Owenweeksia sp.]HBF18636.1 hypothetical protein [Cryomorphaceae bacterium]HCQ16215.1 hypothetical protein [Cryomorphaceae bacterium]|tara:strand:- start:771 stop:1574 length:804 start_codon:yes stop_codon:yes gene_type:complete